MASRVVPAMSETMTRSSPRMRLMREDLPTLGLPMTATLMTSLLLFLLLLRGEVVNAGVQQVAGAVAVDGGDGDGVAQAQVIELIDIRVRSCPPESHLVHRQHHRLAGSAGACSPPPGPEAVDAVLISVTRKRSTVAF